MEFSLTVYFEIYAWPLRMKLTVTWALRNGHVHFRNAIFVIFPFNFHTILWVAIVIDFKFLFFDF
jgi:hypothetical protein